MMRRDRAMVQEVPSEKMSTTYLSSEDEAAGKKPAPWSGIDLSGKVLLHLGTDICQMNFLTHLYLAKNELEYLPHEIGQLQSLEVLDVSSNKLQDLPRELGSVCSLKELVLYNNHLTNLPFELGRLHQLRVLSLQNNPLAEPLLSFAQESADAVISYLLENSPVARAPPERKWIYPDSVDINKFESQMTQNTVTVFCYNVLCDKYATRQVFRYCPQWALDWEHRKHSILKEILTHMSDIVSLQEVESSQYHHFFAPQMTSRSYEGIFKPKSRARTMNQDTVDGCAIFYHTTKYRLKQEYLIEFERLSTRYASGCTDMLNRVMPKDNIALCALLEHVKTKEQIFVCNLHLTWDPMYKDVKVIQMALALTEIETFMQEHDCSDIPMLIMGDFNSLHDSGVYELMDKGRLSPSHADLEGYDYQKFFETVGLSHNKKLKSAYINEMPYSNYTAAFTGIIDYIWYSSPHMVPTALLGPVDKEYMEQNVEGCPNAHFPSDHLALSAEFTFLKR